MAPEWLRLVVAAACAASGVAVLRRRLSPASAVMLMACACLLAVTGATETSTATRFAVSSLVTPVAPLCGAVAGLWWPVRPVTRPFVVAGSAALGAALAAGTLHTMAFDPAATGCSRCPENPLLVTSASARAGSFDRTGVVLVALAGLLVTALAVLRWSRAAALARITTWPMLLGGAAVAALATFHSIRVLAEPRDVFDAWARPTEDVQLVLILVVAAGSWWRLSLPRRTTDRVARRVLAATPDPAALLASLADEVGDADLVVTYRRQGGERIDVEGRPAAVPEGRAVARLTRDGATYAEIWYAAPLDPQGDILRAVADSSGLALEYVAAQGRLRAENLDAVSARRRVVATADAERSRLERDLHDGAQQGLITLSLQLTAAAAGGRSAGLGEAQAEITLALQDLRTVARGLFPVSLSEAGLVAALRELGDHTQVPLVVEGTPGADAGAEADMAFYNVVVDVASATPQAPGAVVRVELGTTDTRARIQVSATPADTDRARRLLVRAEDRLAALGGTLSVVVTGETLLVEGEVPCAS